MSEATGDRAVDRAAELEVALEAATAAGRAVMESFGTDQEVRHKGPDQPVTEADLVADAMLKERLLAARPGYGWLSEESVDRPERLDRAKVWIVDPIDGTRSFIEGYREFAVSVALAEEGRPVVGVIYNPARDHMVWATAGGGGRSMTHWTSAPPAGTAAAAEAARGEEARSLDVLTGAPDTLLASRSERAEGEFEPFEAGWTIREVGSTAWKLAGTAMGEGAYISRGPKSEWDVAAGVLIVGEAGGVVTDLDGRVITFNRAEPYVHGVVAGRPADHARLLERARTLHSPRLGRESWKGDNEG